MRDLGNTTNKPHSSVFSLSDKSFVQINTLTCSTLLTQNEHILNVLGWRCVLAEAILPCTTDLVRPRMCH
ncbi:unnamed protein product [Heligmosomoides polygyrus]|uniref:Uncharacterized protein n=1 Tax=Heligmosomoides polygyrus TaxID=6339 RepID=A0A3P7U8S7_HELPZ|nr:unnamed protein product [Heligmosomoides polygyrus]